MKTRYILFSLVAVSSAVFAGYYVPWDKAKPPTLSLPVAYERALAALGAATNELHCISARVDTDFSRAGEWEFAFYSTNTPPKTKFVSVSFEGKIRVQNFQGSFR
jgi:hypothetical protein